MHCSLLRRKFPAEWNVVTISIGSIFLMVVIALCLTSFCNSVNLNPISDSFGTLSCICKSSGHQVVFKIPINSARLTTLGFL